MVEERTGGQWEKSETHELNRILEYPNPSFDWSMIMRQAVYLMDLSGDAYMSIVRNGQGRIGEIWPLVPDEMQIMAGMDNMVSQYRYRKGAVRRDIPASDILHLKYANPGDIYYGLSPLHAAARAVDIDEEAENWQKTSLQNMAVPPGALVMEGDVTQQQYDQAKEMVNEQSGPENARKPWVLANASWQAMGGGAADLDFINGRKMTREEICSAYSMPPPLVGIYDNATLSNIETARQILWREGLIPALDEIEGQLNLQLTAEYGPNVRITYDLSNIEALQENLGEKLTNARTLWSMGVPLTEVNRKLDLGLMTDDIVGADVGYLPGGLLPTDFEINEADQIPGGRDTARAANGEDVEA
jgi:HK97 family phage portal protein